MTLVRDAAIFDFQHLGDAQQALSITLVVRGRAVLELVAPSSITRHVPHLLDDLANLAFRFAK
jgi:hypothetical protein